MVTCLNKTFKHQKVAYFLREDGGSPNDITDWISTGSRWLDSIVCRGQLAGIPVGKILPDFQILLMQHNIPEVL